MIPIIILAIEDDDDREYMASLYIKYNRLMYSEIKKVISDPWDIEDVLQVSLVKLIDKVKLLRSFDRNRLVRYIISTCRNNAYKHSKKLSNISEYEILEEDGEDVASKPLEEIILKKEHQRILLEAWQSLDERSRYFLECKYILEKSDAEIAADMNLKPSSVRMNLTRSRNKFKALVEKAQE